MELSTAKKDVAVQLPYNCVRPPAPSPSTATGRRSPRRWGAGRSAANCAGTVQYSTVQYNEMSCTGRGRPASTGPTTPGGTAACSATPWPGTRAANEPSRSFHKAQRSMFGAFSGHSNTSRRFVDISTRFSHTKRGDIYDVSGIRTCGGQRYSEMLLLQ